MMMMIVTVNLAFLWFLYDDLKSATRFKLQGWNQEPQAVWHSEENCDDSLLASRAVFLNRWALASIIPGRERPEETTICYKISLVKLITNLNVILYLSTCHTVYISVLILFMIMP